MATIKSKLLKIGNQSCPSYAITIPKALLRAEQVDLNQNVEIEIKLITEDTK
jgi:antitoxin component of MazEF toxin-antitoxin module